jgi:hypothetical protein
MIEVVQIDANTIATITEKENGVRRILVTYYAAAVTRPARLVAINSQTFGAYEHACAALDIPPRQSGLF